MRRVLVPPTVAVCLAAVLGSASAQTPINLTIFGSAYTQNFDTLANSGTSSAVPAGWMFSESGTNADTTYAAGTGSSNTGNTYSFGSSGSSERAFGGLLSGSLVPTIGAAFTNRTGSTITSLAISYMGEQWRLGNTGRQDKLSFQYSTDATSLTTGTWKNVNTLDFIAPVQAGSVGALNGNLAVNRSAISATINGTLSIHDGVTFWIRWTDFNATGADDGLAIDDFSLTANGNAGVDDAPIVLTTTPANGGTNVAVNANIAVTFSEAVNVTDPWFTIVCTISGSHAAAVSGGPAMFTLNPSTDFSEGESCTVTVLALQVTDQDANDPPDNMLANFTFGFTTALPITPIHTIQGQAHISPYNGQLVKTSGIVTVLRTTGSSRGFYLQDPNPDAIDATSEGIFVFTGSSSDPSALVAVGDSIIVTGRVNEFRPGGISSTNLTITELDSPVIEQKVSSGNALPPPIVIGAGGRVPPTMIIEDDATGDVETSGVFDPAADGIDFYESLESMRVRINNAVIVGPAADFTTNREIPVIGDSGAGASVLTPRGGIVIRSNDYNPERVILNDVLGSPTLPATAKVADTFPGAIIGVMDYSFGNFKLQVTQVPALASGGLAQESTTAAAAGQVSIATFNVENLDPTDPQSKFDTLAALIVNNLKNPDIIAVEEIQDNNGATNDSTVDASVTYGKLIAAIATAGGPAYDYRQIDPVDDQDGGETGGNIRQGFLFRTDRGLAFVDRPGAGSLTANAVVGTGSGTHLLYSPGRIDPTNTAFVSNRKPLAGEFLFNGHRLFVIANHFLSKGGDQPLYGHLQPPALVSEVQRLAQAQVVHDFVQDILAADAQADVVVVGDLNDFQFSAPVQVLAGTPTILNVLLNTLPENERYTYVFEGNSEALDHTLLSPRTFSRPFAYDVVHVNSEFAVQSSDHDPQVAQIAFASALGLTMSVEPSVFALFGQPLVFTFTATNQGDVEALNVTISAPLLGPLTCTPAQPVTLQPGESLVCKGTHVVNQTDLDTGGFTAGASAQGSFGEVTVSADPVELRVPAVQNPRLSLVKSADAPTFGAVGDVISYFYSVMNTGNVTLTGPVVLADNKVPVLNCPVLLLMPPGLTMSCTGTYTVQPADVTATEITNTAKATAAFAQVPVNSNVATVTVIYKRQIASPSHKGSLLIFPDIDVRGTRTTVVQIVNDGDTGAYVKCVYQDFNKNRSDFVFTLTAHQPAWFDVSSGRGSIDVNTFPDGYGAGELICFAVGTADEPRAFNQLTGSAIVMDFQEGRAYEYAAAAFASRGLAQVAPGNLLLDGRTGYDQCFKYLVGTFTPSGATVTTSRGQGAVLMNRLAISSCTQDLRQDFVPVTTKLQFDIWNADEVKFTGTWECADSWHEVVFGGPTIWKGANSKTLTASRLKTNAAYYRVEGVRSAVCDNLSPWNVPTQPVGLIGVLSTVIDVDGTVQSSLGTTVVGAGTRSGTILYDSSSPTPEGRR